MFFKCVHAETLKLKRSPVWLVFLALPVLPAIMGTFNYMNNLDMLKQEWYSLWQQHTLFSCYFFIPALIGIYCSYLFRLEHTNHNWYTVSTSPIPRSFIYFSKLLIVTALVALTQVWIGVLFIISGKLIGISSPVPAALPVWLLYGTAGGIAVCALQLMLSMVIHSFAVPVGISMIGSIGGIAALAKGIAIWYPYSLLSLGMHANSPASEMPINTLQFFTHCALYLLLFSLFALVYLNRRDVSAI